MRSPHFYRVQRRLVACDVELPWLPAAAPAATPDLAIRLGSRVEEEPRDAGERWYGSEATGEGGRPALTIDRHGDDYRMEFADGTVFVIGTNGTSIALAGAPAQYTIDDLAAYALGSVLAVALHLQGAVLLHASAVVLPVGAVLFAGRSGSGKSTTAALLHEQGYPVLADDLLEVSGSGPYRAVPSMPTLRLWPEAVHALFGAGAEFPDRAPSWDKKVVALPPDVAGEELRAIAAILLLEPEGRDRLPRLERLPPTEAAWRALIPHSYTARLPDLVMMRRIFDVTASLAATVPLYRFTPPALEWAGGLGAFLEQTLGEDRP